MSDADALDVIASAIQEHQRAGGGVGHPWDLAIFRAGERAGRASK